MIYSSISFYVATSYLILSYAGRVQSLDEPAMDEMHKEDIELFQNIYNYIQSCIIVGNVDPGECLEMFRGAPPTQARYDSCKCLVPCVAKKLDLMYTDGTYDFNGLRNISKMIQSEYYRKEVDRVLDICETEPGTECEGGYNIVNCAVQHSYVAGRSIRMMMESLDEHYGQSSQKDMPKQKADD